MESNWRQNILGEGMQCSDWLLCAHVLGTPFLAVVNPDLADPTKYRVYHVFGTTQLPVLVLSVPIPATHPHFPYGVSVEAD